MSNIYKKSNKLKKKLQCIHVPVLAIISTSRRETSQDQENCIEDCTRIFDIKKKRKKKNNEVFIPATRRNRIVRLLLGFNRW